MLVKSQTVFSKNNAEAREICLENVLFSVSNCLPDLKQPVYSDDKKEYIGNLFLDETRKVTKEDLEEGTCVFFVKSFLNAKRERSENLKQAEMQQPNQIYVIYDDYIFYIQKYNIYLNFEQFCAFTQNKLDEKFIIVDGDNAVDRMFVFIDSSPNEITQTFYSINFFSGKFVKEAIQKSTSTYIWGDMQLLKPKDGRVCDFSEVANEYRYYDTDEKRLIVCDCNQQYGVKQFDIVNEQSGVKMNRDKILKVYLNIPGSTRMATFINCSGFSWRICDTEMNNSNANIRFGLRLSEEDRGYYRAPSDDVYLEDIFPYSKIEDEVREKVYNKLKQDLIHKVNCHRSLLRTSEYGGSTNIPYFSKDIVIVTKPVPGHRRPTYHLITGFMVRDEIEIVELARGELQMKDMTPVSTYFLLSGEEDKYVRIGRRYYSQIKEAVTEAEVDKSSIEDWAEEKAQHPQLLKAISQKANQEKFNLDIVKTFNRVPFGSLLLEQLIKVGYDDLSIRIAKYILDVGDNMNYNISSLGDMLPGCNPEASSLLSILNLTKPCYELLMKDVNTICDIKDFFIKYNVIKKFVPDGIITKERSKLISSYFELYNSKDTSYYITGGQCIDILKYPEIIKSIYKMLNKIKVAFKNTRFTYDAEREYNEIVKAYLSFKELHMDPEEYKIFIEFSLGDTNSPEAAYAELHSREVAANTGLKICEDKMNEKIHREKETKYAYRKDHALKKLVTLKASEQKELGNYIITAPSQIYGEKTVGSIEKEGHDMGHCVYRSYANDIAEGKYTVLYLRKKAEPDKSFVTIGINSAGRINQTYTYNDNYISTELAAVISKWAEFKKDYVTFKSEHDSVRPGGWPSNCGVPDLPKPTGEWIRQLARVE